MGFPRLKTCRGLPILLTACLNLFIRCWTFDVGCSTFIFKSKVHASGIRNPASWMFLASTPRLIYNNRKEASMNMPMGVHPGAVYAEKISGRRHVGETGEMASRPWV